MVCELTLFPTCPRTRDELDCDRWNFLFSSPYSSEYDGGDCCECTCDPTKNFWDDDGACGQWAGFACIDPAAPCVDDDSVTIDMPDNCSGSSMGNGYCDDDYNNPECGMSRSVYQFGARFGHTLYVNVLGCAYSIFLCTQVLGVDDRKKSCSSVV